MSIKCPSCHDQFVSWLAFVIHRVGIKRDCNTHHLQKVKGAWWSKAEIERGRPSEFSEAYVAQLRRELGFEGGPVDQLKVRVRPRGVDAYGRGKEEDIDTGSETPRDGSVGDLDAKEVLG